MTSICRSEVKPSVDYKQLYELERNQNIELKEQNTMISKENHVLRLRDIPMSNYGHEWMMNLQYKVKYLSERVASFESCEIYVNMKADHKSAREADFREIKKLKEEIATLNVQLVTMRENWWQVFDDMQKAHEKELDRKNSAIKILNEKLLETYKQLYAEKDKTRDLRKELYEVKTELEEEKGKNQKLQSQFNRDHKNSSLPSSANPFRKNTITNNREKSDKAPGAQPGHEWHGRRWYDEPTNEIKIPAPLKLLNNPMYELTGNLVRKQRVGLRVEVIIDEFSTLEFRNIITGQIEHADFPENMNDEVTYDGSVKAFAFLLKDYFNVAIDKVADFMFDITGGKLKLSHGLICALSKQFSDKTEDDRNKILADILLAPALNVDFTSARVNGKRRNVLVCSDGLNVLYYARMNKGHKGIFGTAIAEYLGTLIHDHDLTFYKYGSFHQECLDHILRYLKDSMENETHLKWSGQMRELIREIIHWRKHLDPEDRRNPNEIEPEKVAEFEKRYDEILERARLEYEYEPPSDYYKKGFNLYKRMGEYKSNHLLFLYDKRVPHTNSLAERLLRIYRRKERQAMTFRSFEGLEYLCNSLSMIASLREQGKNLYQGVSEIFNRTKSANGKIA